MPRVELRNYRKARTPFGSLMRLFRYFKHCRPILICAVISILVYAGATIAASYCMKPLVNLLKQTGLAPDEVYAKYLALLIGLAGLYLLSTVTNYLLNRLMLECGTVIMRALRTEMFSKMQKLPIRYFDANTNGSLMSYFTNDIEATNELLQHSITQMLISVLSLLGTIGMMLVLSMKLFSLMVVLAAIVILVVRYISKKSSRSYRAAMTGAACRCEIEKNSGIMYDPRVASAALAHWDTLISRYAADTPRTPYFDRLMLERTRQAHDYLVANQDSRITLAELAVKFHLSQSSLKLCFKALYGVPVAGYLRTVRMDTAARLLQESDLPVAEIAHRVGYEDPSRFSAAFRRHTGRRPTELRRVACPCAE